MEFTGRLRAGIWFCESEGGIACRQRGKGVRSDCGAWQKGRKWGEAESGGMKLMVCV